MDEANTTSAGSIKSTKNMGRVKAVGVVATLFGVGIFVYYVYAVGPQSVLDGIASIGFGGFLIILCLYGLKLLTRAIAWHLTVYEPHSVSIKETLPAVMIGEALSSVIPLGILVSGTAKALAIRRKVPIVPALASVATENLFYSLITGLFISFGAILFIRRYELPYPFDYFVDLVLAVILISIVIGAAIVIRQWKWATRICDELYKRGILTSILRNGRLHMRMFENLIFGFYRAHPKRFFPLCGLQVLFHFLGVLEVWFILSRIGDVIPSITAPFFLESMNRLVTVVFKLVPFLFGVDEASAEFVVEALGIGVGMGVTLAIVRKGRVIVFALAGFILIIKRGLKWSEVKELQEAHAKSGNI
ncbi:MAG: hypothetical protein HKN33_14450 [Pyrinomonadaceae bacterium]|nr:hypothetical protein [Pyrinomonadaceae bacterium]